MKIIPMKYSLPIAMLLYTSSSQSSIVQSKITQLSLSQVNILSTTHSPKIVHIDPDDEVDDDATVKVSKHDKKAGLDASSKKEVLKDAEKTLAKKDKKHKDEKKSGDKESNKSPEEAKCDADIKKEKKKTEKKDKSAAKEQITKAMKHKEKRTMKKQDGKNIRNAIARTQKVNEKIEEKEENKKISEEKTAIVEKAEEKKEEKESKKDLTAKMKVGLKIVKEDVKIAEEDASVKDKLEKVADATIKKAEKDEKSTEKVGDKIDKMADKTKIASGEAKEAAGELKATGKISGKLNSSDDAKEQANDIKEAAKESKNELKEAAKESKANGSYSQDELETIGSMAARHAAVHVANALKHGNAEKHLHSKELKKINKEISEKKPKIREATHASIKASVEKAVIKSMSPVKPPFDFTEGWQSSSSSLNNKVFNKIYAKQFKHSNLGSDHMSALEGLTDSPVRNGLNAATAAGIEIAKNTLKKIHQGDRVKEMLGKKGKIPGLTSTGFLDEEDDD